MSGLVLFFDLLHFFIETTKRTQIYASVVLQMLKTQAHYSALLQGADTHV